MSKAPQSYDPVVDIVTIGKRRYRKVVAVRASADAVVAHQVTAQTHVAHDEDEPDCKVSMAPLHQMRPLEGDAGGGELIEFVFGDRSVQISNVAEAEATLRELAADLRLDLHGCMDLLSPQEVVVPSGVGSVDVCVVSFVGRKSQMRTQAREDLQTRIDAGQIKFGALLFRRGDSQPGTKYARASVECGCETSGP